MVDPELFNRDPERYRRARPPYPAALWDRLRDEGLLSPGLRVLDIGAGTGEATETFARAGSRVTALEPGAGLARLLRERLPGVPVLEATLEEAELQHSEYDAVSAATSFHWLDHVVALPKLHRALTPGGRLAVWWQVFGDPDAEPTPFRRCVAEIVRDRTPRPRRPGPLDIEHWVSTFESGGLFTVEAAEDFRWPIHLTADEIRDLFGTFSDWSTQEVLEAHAAAVELGPVTEHFRTVLYLARAS